MLLDSMEHLPRPWCSTAVSTCLPSMTSGGPLRGDARQQRAGELGPLPVPRRTLAALVGQLSTRSHAFRTRWAAHDVKAHRAGVKVFWYPLVEEICSAPHPGQVQDRDLARVSSATCSATTTAPQHAEVIPVSSKDSRTFVRPLTTWSAPLGDEPHMLWLHDSSSPTASSSLLAWCGRRRRAPPHAAARTPGSPDGPD